MGITETWLTRTQGIDTDKYDTIYGLILFNMLTSSCQHLLIISYYTSRNQEYVNVELITPHLMNITNNMYTLIASEHDQDITQLHTTYQP